MNEPRDTLVGDALRRLDVPDHAPDFWSLLEGELAEGPAGADQPGDQDGAEHGADVVELDDAASRRGPAWTRRPLLAAAAVVAVVALVVGAAVLRPGGDDESQLDVAEEPGEVDPGPDATEPPDTTAPGPTTSEPTAPETPAGDEAATRLAAEELAGEWLTLLRAGDPEDAHALLDAPSQARLPLEDFRQVSSGLAEGAGAFAADGVTSTAVVIERPGGPAAIVVTFVGDVEREGMVETAGYPVVVTGDDPEELGIAFVLDGPTVELEELSSPTETRTSPVRMTTSETAEVWVTVDGSEPERIAAGPAVVDVEAIAGAGTHVLTVIATQGGLYTARAATVVVP